MAATAPTTRAAWRVAVSYKAEMVDAAAEGLKTQVADLGIRGVESVAITQVYYLVGALTPAALERLAHEGLTDPITQTSEIVSVDGWTPCTSCSTIEVASRPGVMDSWEASVMKGTVDLGITGLEAVHTAKAYTIRGTLPPGALEMITHELLVNPVIEMVVTSESLPTLLARPEAAPPRITQPITVSLSAATDTQLQQLSARAQLALSLEEMRAIQTHFRGLRREPTDVELETIAQTWSEHCKHKTLRGQIVYTDETGRKRVIDNLLKATIMRATEELQKPWCLSVFVDNAGVIEFDEETAVCFKVETHNHPSAIEPFGGANTGVGGVIRDILGTGRGAKPVANTDVFCFAPPDLPPGQLPDGVLSPTRIMKGVVAGVQDYGNKMGIPTVNGAVLFDERFAGNPLVYCGTVGILPKGAVTKSVQPGALIVVAGGRTGRDGIHGATFSSEALTAASNEVSATAVQIGNPITEKTVADAILEARDRELFTAITDCGAGGLSSAVGELGEACGARVELEQVPLKYAGLSYAEIWISEAQERMVLAVPPGQWEAFHAVCRTHAVEATVIGAFTDTRRLELFFHGVRVADLSMEFLHHGVPRVPRPARWVPPTLSSLSVKAPADLTPTLLALLARWDSCSKEPIIRRYDHEVQGGSAMKPLVGRDQQGPSDAAIVRPRLGSPRAIIISNGINVRYGDLDPYWMAAAAIDEALRQIIAVGGSLERVALLDNFCWGDTNRPEILGSLVRAALGCYDMAKAYGTPFISGKDSLHNEYRLGRETRSIPGTLLISAIGIMPDVTKAVSMDLKAPGHALYLVGVTKAELGGSAYWALQGALGADVPKTDPARGRAIFEALSHATAAGLVRACHDCSEGGMALALAEMAFAGGVGVRVNLSAVPTEGTLDRDDTIAFSESTSRLLIEVAQESRAALERALTGVPFAAIGETVAEPTVTLLGRAGQHPAPNGAPVRPSGQPVVQASLESLQRAWQQPLEAYF